MAFSNPPKSSANRDEKIPGSPFKASTSSPESSDRVTKFEFLQKNSAFISEFSSKVLPFSIGLLISKSIGDIFLIF